MLNATENGKLMGSAIRAVLEMQSDCVRLFRDLDKQLELSDLRAISLSSVTTGIGISITSPALYLAQYLYRLYARKDSEHNILGINICFHEHPKQYFEEPIFVVSSISYDPQQASELLAAVKSWDPWTAFLGSQSEKTYGIAVECKPFRGTIRKVLVAAVPLYSIDSIEVALSTLDLVKYPDLSTSLPS